jgi:hypothetical protein
MFPTIPEDLSTLDGSALRSLAAEISTACQSRLSEAKASGQAAEITAASTEVVEWSDKRKEVLAEAAKRDADEAARVAADAAVAEMATEVVEPEVVEPEVVEAEVVEPEVVETPASAAPIRVREGTATGATPEATTRLAADCVLARKGVKGDGGERFESWNEVALALADQATRLRPGSTERFGVAYVPGRFDEAHTLQGDPTFNLELFDTETLASMCAPAQPNYELGCWNSTARPFRGSLGAYKPDMRGAVSIYPSPSFSDITGGVGIWTAEDDADLEAVKEECQRIECAEPEIYRLYGVYRCLTVKNLEAMTFPELVEAYLNRLAAKQARVAEIALMDAAATAATEVTAPKLGYGASVTVTSTILNLLAHWEEQERWDVDGVNGWAHRRLLRGIKMDILRRRTENGLAPRVPSDAEVSTMFANVGVNINWVRDVPAWMTANPTLSTSNTLNPLVRGEDILLAPRGKFAVLDRGELSIGVAGSNLYRDNASNARNEFTFFFENFEGLVNTDSCPAYLLHLDDLCYNGQQIADVAMDCEGQDYAGIGS